MLLDASRDVTSHVKNVQPAPHDPHSHSYSLSNLFSFAFFLDRASRKPSANALSINPLNLALWLLDSFLLTNFLIFCSSKQYSVSSNIPFKIYISYIFYIFMSSIIYIFIYIYIFRFS